MDLASLTRKAQDALSSQNSFNNVVKLDFGSVGKLLLDGVNSKASNEDGNADATVTVSWDDFVNLAKGQLDPTMALMRGKLKVDGDMSVIMKLQGLISKFA